jgi:hypothetical protein
MFTTAAVAVVVGMEVIPVARVDQVVVEQVTLELAMGRQELLIQEAAAVPLTMGLAVQAGLELL